jgi:uncharacterized membrane protein
MEEMTIVKILTICISVVALRMYTTKKEKAKTAIVLTIVFLICAIPLLCILINMMFER